MSTLLIDRVRVLTAAASAPGLGVIDDGAVVVADGRIAWVGPRSELPAHAAGYDEHVDGQGRLLSPGLIDCHTHLPFGGDRAAEFALRAAGADYATIANAGGGIVSTVRSTRTMSDAALRDCIITRAQQLQATGITTIEAKSGYELTTDGEVRSLRCIAEANASVPSGPALIGTLLAHVVPVEARGSAAERAAWVHAFCELAITAAAAQRLATSVDVYCDEGAYTLDEASTIWRAAHAAGLAVRGHIGQFADLGAADILAEIGAWSADHLEQISAAGAQALARAGTIAVMIPTACVQLKQAQPPIGLLRDAGLRFAIASDLNPGTSYAVGLGVPMWLATTHYGLTVEETWLGVTRHAAAAVGRPDLGQIAIGAPADLALWNTDQPAALPYRIGENLLATVWQAGVAR
ncbi:MAG TPA: imidazolonepropionase [Kofleriaceae bacterium]|nr:imidazolonepropionase [Kofleriaceae bacterium]